MLTARRRRNAWAIALSALLHLGLAAAVWLQRPMIAIPEETGPPLPAIIPVLLMPRIPAAGRLARPEPIRLHRRPQRFVPPEVPTLPVAPPAPAARAAPAPAAPPALHPAPLPEGPKGDVRTALRQSPVGCANRDAVGLTKAERDLCDEKLGKGVRTATPFDVGTELTAEKKRMLDAAMQQRDDDIRYKRENTPPPPGQGAAPAGGATAEDMCRSLGIPPEKCGAKVRR